MIFSVVDGEHNIAPTYVSDHLLCKCHIMLGGFWYHPAETITHNNSHIQPKFTLCATLYSLARCAEVSVVFELHM